MSDRNRELQLLDGGTGWRHWEMEHFDQASTPRSGPAGATGTVPGAHDSRAAADADRGECNDGPRDGDASDPDARRKELLEKAHLEAKAEGFKEGFEKGRKEGHESGLAAGRKTATQEIDRARRDVLAPLRAMADEYGKALDVLSEETTTQLVELALAVGESMALNCVEEDRLLITRVVRSILDGELAPMARPELLLNPADLEALRETLGEELRSSGWQLVPDEKVTRGGCLLRNQLSEIDATWESRWQTITSRLRRRGGEGTSPGASENVGETERSAK